MKLIVTILLAFLSITSYCQCVQCNSFKEALKKPEKVKSIIINANMHEAIDSLPKSISKFENLEFLYLTDQTIDTIPIEIAKLTKLKELSFGGCQLRAIPDYVFQLKNLKELVLYNNQFTEEYKKELELKCRQELPNTKLLLDL